MSNSYGSIRFDALNSIFDRHTERNSKERTAECKYCDRVFSSYKLNRLVKHAYSCRKLEDKEPALLLQLKDEVIAYEERRKEAENRDSRSTYRALAGQERAQMITRLLVKFVACNALPLSTIQSTEFAEILCLIDKKYKPPSPTTFRSRDVAHHAKNCYETVMGKLLKGQDYELALELDGWSCSKFHLIGIIVTLPSGCSTLLNLLDITSIAHTASNLSRAVIRELESHNLSPKKFNCVVSDEASNYKGARVNLQQSTGGRVIQYRCMAHFFNLIGSTASSSFRVRPIIEKLQIFVATVTRNSRLIRKLEELRAKKLIKICPTRWYTTSSSISSALETKESLKKLDEDESLGYSRWIGTVNDEEFWSSLKKLQIMFSQLSEAIGYCERANSKLSDAFWLLLRFGNSVMTSRSQNFQLEFKESFLYHFKKLDLGLLLAAYYLDPNYRLKFLTLEAEKKAWEFIIRMLLAMNNSLTNNAVIEAIKTDTADYKSRLLTHTNDIDDVFEWWSDSQDSFLKLIAIRLSRMHASSANTERIFSSLQRDLTPSRNQLSFDTMTNLLRIRLFHKKNLDTEPSVQQLRRGIRQRERDGSTGSTRHQSTSDELLDSGAGTSFFDNLTSNFMRAANTGMEDIETEEEVFEDPAQEFEEIEEYDHEQELGEGLTDEYPDEIADSEAFKLFASLIDYKSGLLDGFESSSRMDDSIEDRTRNILSQLSQ